MPLTCPHCRIVQAEGGDICINCGRPLTSAEEAAPPAGDATVAGSDAANAPLTRRASWRLPAVIAFGLLLALAASAFFAAQRGVPRRTARTAPAPPPALPPSAPPAPGDVPSRAAPVRDIPASSAVPALPPAETPAPRAVKPPAGAVPPTVTLPAATPLTVTLDSTREGRHVRVGEDVTLTALAHGRSATLTLFYRRGRGERAMLTFVEGSLCSTTWTPAAPGRYEFTATALGDHKQSAASRRIEITVDAPAPPVEARAAPAPPRVAAPPLPAVRRVRRSPGTAARDAAPEGGRRPALTYHVAAAKFPFLRNATVLADALSRRGYQAVPERMDDAHGKTVYVVVTGSYHGPKEARAAALDLQRSGYPAYFFGGR